ncbi:MAG: NAD(P)-dependent oxidoreductase [Oligoflexales bacterium]
MKLAFIGLGVMGFPMAGHLKRAGHQITVYNRTKEKALRFKEIHGGAFSDSPIEAVKEAEVIFLCVGNDDDVRAITHGEYGVLVGMQPGSILVDHTTTSADLAQELADLCNKQKASFLDAPVSGGQNGAEQGSLTIMLGGDSTDYSKVEMLLSCYARKHVLLGPVGHGQLAKMANQICIAGILQGLSEALNFAEKSGLDGSKLIHAISKGAAQSWQMDNRAETMLSRDYDFGFAIKWMIKDLGFCLNKAEELKVPLPLTQQVADRYLELADRHKLQDCDTSVLVEYLRRDDSL